MRLDVGVEMRIRILPNTIHSKLMGIESPFRLKFVLEIYPALNVVFNFP